MDWFERLTGFRETNYLGTRAKFRVEGEHLISLVNGERYGIGNFELVSLQTLRDRVAPAAIPPGRLRLSFATGDIRDLHRMPTYAGALIQVASQFNCLEMVSPKVTPEDGVTNYQHDQTQGPACSIAAGAATIFRNYFVPIGNAIGQTRELQLDGLADLGAALSAALNMPPAALWTMTNGYALCTESGLAAISAYLASLNLERLDHLRGKLRIGLHMDVQITDGPGDPPQVVSQAFCSALPVAYSSIDPTLWAPFARFILEAAYEATLLAAVLNHNRGGSHVVLLTHLGGGAFGNDRQWIDDAIRRSLKLLSRFDLDVRIVSLRVAAFEMPHTTQPLQSSNHSATFHHSPAISAADK
jgi:hypothetical protein